ncbi:iron siderophore-binding protein [Anopheles sinensis]|uniref:Iron siderophore-binding protein n=1 Tax=Anopheles sinensis TaxID=74873 RepID=A0A084VPU5_ANOSI|nr:iron siderophore-binding protein [Anopheles sinensis]
MHGRKESEPRDATNEMEIPDEMKPVNETCKHSALAAHCVATLHPECILGVMNRTTAASEAPCYLSTREPRPDHSRRLQQQSAAAAAEDEGWLICIAQTVIINYKASRGYANAPRNSPGHSPSHRVMWRDAVPIFVRLDSLGCVRCLADVVRSFVLPGGVVHIPSLYTNSNSSGAGEHFLTKATEARYGAFC